MKKTFTTFFALAAVITFFAALAMADKGQAVYVPQDSVLPDGQVLKTGDYRVVVDEAGKEVQFWHEDRMVAKHECKVEPLDKKARSPELRFSETAEKKRCLREVRLAGRKEAFVLATESGL